MTSSQRKIIACLLALLFFSQGVAAAAMACQWERAGQEAASLQPSGHHDHHGMSTDASAESAKTGCCESGACMTGGCASAAGLIPAVPGTAGPPSQFWAFVPSSISPTRIPDSPQRPPAV